MNRPKKLLILTIVLLLISPESFAEVLVSESHASEQGAGDSNPVESAQHLGRDSCKPFSNGWEQTSPQGQSLIEEIGARLALEAEQQ